MLDIVTITAHLALRDKEGALYQQVSNDAARDFALSMRETLS